MRQAKLKRKTLSQARKDRNKGIMTQEDYLSVVRVCNDDAAMREYKKRVDDQVNPWTRADGLIGMDWTSFWANIWDWFSENWPEILKIILTVAPLLLLEPKRENS